MAGSLVPESKRSSCVASRWRIRHKLTLGLGLVLGVMVLLLGGTLRGLWSYYLTMNSIRHKLSELKAAEKLRENVGILLHPQAKAGAGDAYSRYESLPPLINDVGNSLDLFRRELQNTIDQGHAADHDDAQLLRVAALRQRLEELEQALGNLTKEVAAPLPDGEILKQNSSKVDKLILQADVDAKDLIKVINEGLNRDISDSRSHYQITLWILLPTSIVGLVVVFGLLRSFYAWVFYPIRDLEAGVQRVARGDLAHRIEVHSGDEMEELGAAFNDMMQRLQYLYSDLARQVNERSRQLVRSERLASVGFLAAGVAHEINNPLASIAFCSEALDSRLSALLSSLPPDVSEEEREVFGKYLKMIQDEAFRCKNITEKLLAFSRTGERRREPTDLRELVQSVLDVTQHLQNHRGKEIIFDVQTERVAGGRIVAWVSAEEIKSVVLNLVVNALDSMDEGGRLTIHLRLQGDQAEMQFTDTGCGMTQEVLENIFEPFFTRSRTGKGTGLGLTISHRIIIQHGGEIEAASPGSGHGSTFTVRLPLRPPEQPAEPDAPRPERGTPASERRAA
jgi:two-component system NtrC family sensor kinase